MSAPPAFPATGPRLLVAGVALLSICFMAALSLPFLAEFAVVVLSDLGQLAASVAAAAACGYAARRSSGQRRGSWWLLAGGTGSWAAGQLVWTYHEVVRGQEVPFPSLADVGFVAFPLLSAAGLLTWLGTQDRFAARGRDLLDGAIIAASLLVLSWVTTLGSVVAEGGDGWLPVTLSLAYPIGDLVLATLVLLALARGVAERTTLLLVACGLGGLALADSAYVYMVTVGSYTSGDLVSTGWTTGFLLVAAGALTVHGPTSHVRVVRAADGVAVSGRVRLVLPYVPLVGAGVAVCLRLLSAPVTPRVDLALGIVLVTLVLVRQFLAMADNHRLVAELAGARDQLEHQALHDPLTGLANRTLFGDRVQHALTHPGADVSVLFCDLDDFKNVNDALGHEAGDRLLCIVAERLLRCVRPEDTVARLGGDEFAILLEQATDPREVVDRVVHAVQQPYQVSGTTVRTSMSVGVSRHGQADGSGEADAQRLLMRADQAMYAAKAAGKGRARHAPAHRDVPAATEARPQAAVPPTPPDAVADAG